jgi:hypothetical protein
MEQLPFLKQEVTINLELTVTGFAKCAAYFRITPLRAGILNFRWFSRIELSAA